jgi:hypothetical protein
MNTNQHINFQHCLLKDQVMVITNTQGESVIIRHSRQYAHYSIAKLWQSLSDLSGNTTISALLKEFQTIDKTADDEKYYISMLSLEQSSPIVLVNATYQSSESVDGFLAHTHHVKLINACTLNYLHNAYPVACVYYINQQTAQTLSAHYFAEIKNSNQTLLQRQRRRFYLDALIVIMLTAWFVTMLLIPLSMALVTTVLLSLTNGLMLLAIAGQCFKMYDQHCANGDDWTQRQKFLASLNIALEFFMVSIGCFLALNNLLQLATCPHVLNFILIAVIGVLSGVSACINYKIIPSNNIDCALYPN